MRARGRDRRPGPATLRWPEFDAVSLTAPAPIPRRGHDQRRDGGRGDAVVETALHDERPADRLWQGLIGHDAGTERCIRRRQHRRQERHQLQGRSVSRAAASAAPRAKVSGSPMARRRIGSPHGGGGPVGSPGRHRRTGAARRDLGEPVHRWGTMVTSSTAHGPLHRSSPATTNTGPGHVESLQATRQDGPHEEQAPRAMMVPWLTEHSPWPGHVMLAGRHR